MAEGLLKIKNKKVEGGGILREKGRGGGGRLTMNHCISVYGEIQLTLRLALG